MLDSTCDLTELAQTIGKKIGTEDVWLSNGGYHGYREYIILGGSRGYESETKQNVSDKHKALCR